MKEKTTRNFTCVLCFYSEKVSNIGYQYKKLRDKLMPKFKGNEYLFFFR